MLKQPLRRVLVVAILTSFALPIFADLTVPEPIPGEPIRITSPQPGIVDAIVALLGMA